MLAPGERLRTSCRRLTVAYVLAVVLPGLTGLALLPLRAEHPQLIAIILVVPVVATALLGAFGPSLVAALCAGLVFGVIHTEPYWRVAVNDPEAIATTATLILVGLVVGWLCSRVARLRVSAEGRAEELRHLLRAASTTASTSDSASLAAEVCDHLVALLKLRDCRWAPDANGSDVPILLPSGAIMGRVASLGPDRGELPSILEVPASSADVVFGQFVLTPVPRHLVSIEERVVAATIVRLFAERLATDCARRAQSRTRGAAAWN